MSRIMCLLLLVVPLTVFSESGFIVEEIPEDSLNRTPAVVPESETSYPASEPVSSSPEPEAVSPETEPEAPVEQTEYPQGEPSYSAEQQTVPSSGTIYEESPEVTQPDQNSNIVILQSGQGDQQGDPEYTVPQLRNKLSGYMRMNNAGKTLLTSGIVSLGAGTGMLVSGITVMSNGEPVGVFLYLFGFVGMALGPELLAAGIVLKSIGSRKEREYKNRLELQLGINSVSLNVGF